MHNAVWMKAIIEYILLAYYQKYKHILVRRHKLYYRHFQLNALALLQNFDIESMCNSTLSQLQIVNIAQTLFI